MKCSRSLLCHALIASAATTAADAATAAATCRACRPSCSMSTRGKMLVDQDVRIENGRIRSIAAASSGEAARGARRARLDPPIPWCRA